MVGVDIDGVLSFGFRPAEGYDVLISGRLVNEWSRTVQEFGADRPIYLRPNGVYGDQVAAGEWKAEVIGRLGLKRFYEDNAIQAKIIKQKCPSCEVVLVTWG
jgi:hypothetical protein